MVQCFPEPYSSPGGSAKLEIYLSNYATKVELRSVVNAIDTKIPRTSGLVIKTQYDSDK